MNRFGLFCCLGIIDFGILCWKVIIWVLLLIIHLLEDHFNNPNEYCFFFFCFLGWLHFLVLWSFSFLVLCWLVSCLLSIGLSFVLLWLLLFSVAILVLWWLDFCRFFGSQFCCGLQQPFFLHVCIGCCLAVSTFILHTSLLWVWRLLLIGDWLFLYHSTFVALLLPC